MNLKRLTSFLCAAALAVSYFTGFTISVSADGLAKNVTVAVDVGDTAAKITSGEEDELTGVLIHAKYAGNVLEAVKVSSEFTTPQESADIGFAYAEGDKLFMWNSLSEMVPYKVTVKPKTGGEPDDTREDIKEVDTLWSKIAMDMRDAQYGENEFDTDKSEFKHEYKTGLIPSIAPRYARFLRDGGEGSFWDIIPWGSSIILAAYEQYIFYGNKSVLADNYNSAKKYIEYLTEQYNDYNRLYGKDGDERFICAGLGDWGIEQNKGRSRENIETAFYYCSPN